MRKGTLLLAPLLGLSIIANFFLWNSVQTERITARTYELALEQIGTGERREKAERDFATGKHYWYASFGGSEVGLPNDRILATFDVGLIPVYQHARFTKFIETYNSRMHELLTKKVGTPAKKG